MRFLKVLLPVAAAILFAILAVNSFADIKTPMMPFTTEVTLDIGLKAPGITRISLPPVGAIEGTTHRGPVTFEVKLNAVDLGALEELLNQPQPQKTIFSGIEAKANDALRDLLLKVLALSAAGGALGYLLAGPRRLRSLVVGGLVGLLVVSATLFSAYLDYNLEALGNPKFSGAMEYAPWMISFVQRALSGMNEWGEKLGQMAESIETLSEKAQRASLLMEENPSDLVVLHVSDLHNNPAGYEMIKGVVQEFGVDLVIDTGDTSDFGTKVEAKLVQAISDLKVDYLWVAGNHDSAQISRELAGLPNVRVLNGTVEVLGLEVAGLPDPAAKDNDVHSTPGELAQYQQQLRSLIEREQPDLLAVHNWRVAQELSGLVPVILTGHNHKAGWSEVDGSVVINAGSTGAEGLRGFQKAEGSPYTAMLLYLREKEGEYRLKTLDYLEFSPDGTGFSLDRQAIKGNVTSTTNSSEDRQQSPKSREL
ncbi:MAG: metallophosphoesterase family protein [Firmicutes bacterium]|nr:metallophosphoesterase family protein [Bacillota bacterium]